MDLKKAVQLANISNKHGRGGSSVTPVADGTNAGLMPANQNMNRKYQHMVNILELDAGYYECFQCWGTPQSSDDGSGDYDPYFFFLDVFEGNEGRKNFQLNYTSSGEMQFRTFHTGGGYSTGTSGWVLNNDVFLEKLWEGEQSKINEVVSLNMNSKTFDGKWHVLVALDWEGVSYHVVNIGEWSAIRETRTGEEFENRNMFFFNDTVIKFDKSAGTFELLKNRESRFFVNEEGFVAIPSTSDGDFEDTMENGGKIIGIWDYKPIA